MMPASRTIEIGGLRMRIDAPEVLARSLDDKFGAFLVGDAGAVDATLHFDAVDPGFSNDFHLQEEETLPLARGASEVSVLLGPAGGFSAEITIGASSAIARATGARHLGDVDAVVRMILSLVLPMRGALLFHAAAVRVGAPEGRVTVLAGASGAGKSTAARAFSPALCDELVVVHVGERDDDDAVSATPYWRGRPTRSALERLVLLERGTGTRERLGGARALALMTPNLARYVAVPTVDARVFSLLGTLIERRGFERLACPEGDAYLPYLRRALVQECLPC